MRTNRIRRTTTTLFLFLSCWGYALHLQGAVKASTVARENPGYWNQLRGPNGDGTSLAKNLPIEFSETKNLRWKTPIHGEGWSSPVVWDKQIWLTTGREDGSELFAVCVDLESGDVIHDIKVFDHIETPIVKAYKSRSQMNSPASPTPVVERGRLYVHFGSQGTACLDTESGEKLWERRDLHCDQIQYGGSSPIVDQDSLFVAFDGIDEQFFVALDKKTGQTRWKQDRNVHTDWGATLEANGDSTEIMASKPNDNKKSFATAHIIEHNGRRQVVAPGGEAIMSYDPKTGEEFWRVHYLGFYNVAARPLFEYGLLYVNVTGPRERLLVIRPDGSGDVTESHVVWSTERDAPNIPSPIIIDGRLFMVSKNGAVRCLDAKTGEEVWRERLGGYCWASPLYADGKLYFSGKDGKIRVIEASMSGLNVLATNRLNAQFNASPAVAGDAIILRSLTHLYCVAEGGEMAPQPVVASQAKPQLSPTTSSDLETRGQSRNKPLPPK